MLFRRMEKGERSADGFFRRLETGDRSSDECCSGGRRKETGVQTNAVQEDGERGRDAE